MTSETTKEEAAAQTLMQSIVNEIIYSPLNLALVAVIAFLVYKILKGQRDAPSSASRPAEPELPKLRRDFTLAELKNYDGNQEDGRVLLAVNGTVYDVTKGKRFYGPGEFDF
uniref:Cytochrome b5 heme-binding domain-containing protein n=1 Tax=Megaselia scalaris TaxID=36166 RepID=T1GF74_MEGSC